LTLILHGLDKLFTNHRSWIVTVVPIGQVRITTSSIEPLDDSAH